MRRVGLVGFGSIAENGHLPAWLSFPQVEITAVADLSPERLARARQLLPAAELFESPLALIERAEIDTVDICSPPNTHADLIVAACARGIADIVSEKPLVLSEEEYVRIAHARADSGSRVVSINNWMHSDLNRHVSAVLEQGLIGAVRSVELRTGRPDAALGNAGWMPHWRTDPGLSGGGIILDHGWHQIYLLLAWLHQPLTSVRAVIRTADARHYPVEDQATIELDFPRAQGRIELSWTAEERSNSGLILGTDGEIAIHDDRVVVHNNELMREFSFKGRLTQSSYHPDWFEEVFRQNVLDVNRGEADRNFAEAGVLVSAINAAYRSASEQGAPRRPALTDRETEMSDVRGQGAGPQTQ